MMRSLSHAVGVLTFVSSKCDLRFFGKPVTQLLFHHESDHPKPVLFKPKNLVMVHVIECVQIDEVELRTQLKSALASVYCQKLYEDMQEEHRTSLLPYLVPKPVLHPMHSPRWLHFYDEMMHE